MAWHYRDVQTFPAHYGAAMREAVASLNTPILLFTASNAADAKSKCDHFRWYRWCLRERPQVLTALSDLETTYQFRVSKDSAPGGVLIYLTASPTKLSDLQALNPKLWSEISAECQ